MKVLAVGIVVLAMVATAVPDFATADSAAVEKEQKEQTTEPEMIVVPPQCTQFWDIPGGENSPVAWDSLLSFAACIQDSRVVRIASDVEVATAVDDLQLALEPALSFYVAAIEEAPGPTKLRAAYYIGLGQIALITRARISLVNPALRPALEGVLEPHAKLAYLMFEAISRAVIDDPALAPDAVTRNMVRSSRTYTRVLREGWSIPTRDEDSPLLGVDL